MSYLAGFEDILEMVKRDREKVVRGSPHSLSLLLCTQQLESLYDPDLPGEKREIELRFLTGLMGGKTLSEVTERLREILRLLERRGLPNAVCESRVLDAYEAAARRRSGIEPAPTLHKVREEFKGTNHVPLLRNECGIRKILSKTFGLPLGKAKRGRPLGSRAIIRN